MPYKRLDGSYKGSGFLGMLKRPDGGVSSEISIGVPIDGEETEIPSMVPTLSKDELKYLLSMNVEKGRLPNSIVDKAVAFAQQRKKFGMPYFATPGEQRFDLHPDLPRAEVVSDVPLASSRQTVDPNALTQLLLQRGYAGAAGPDAAIPNTLQNFLLQRR